MAHHGTALQGPLPGDGVLADSSSQTRGRGTLPRGVHSPGGHLLHILEELGLGGTRVSNHQAVDAPPGHGVVSRADLRGGPEQGQGQGQLDVIMPVPVGQK